MENNKKIVLILLFLSLSLFLITVPVEAVISSCTASVSPTSVNTSITESFNFTINNTGSTSIIWVRVTRPSANFTVDYGSSNIFLNSTGDASQATLTGGSIAASDTGTVSVFATTGGTEASSADWTVQVSDDGGGASATTCTGSLGTAISGSAPDTTAPEISNIVVSDVTDSQIKITWITNESSNSVVDYGTTASYGSTKSDSSNVTSHAITLDSLSANTTYHYNVKSTDSASNTGESGDNTFVTAQAGTTGTTQTGTTTTTTTTTSTATPTPALDRTPPSLAILTELDKPFEKAPTIKGRASDSSGVTSVDYSIDDGQNWLPVDTLKTAGLSYITFEFVPLGLEDGNYQIKVRAKDGKGNAAISKSYTLVIDRLPPRFGLTLYSLGSQIISSDWGGNVITLAGMNLKTALSAVGGPLTIDLTLDNVVNPGLSLEKFSLTKNVDNGIWMGSIRLTAPGVYTIKAHSIDGAGNITDKDLNSLIVLDGGRVLDDSRPIANAVVSVYSYDRLSSRFVLWDGAPYGVINPQKTDKNGRYSLYLPSGVYYLHIQAKGYHSLKTNIFTLEQNLPVTDSFHLKQASFIAIDPWRLYIPDFKQTDVEISLSLPKVASSVNAYDSLQGKELPGFKLNFEGRDFNNFSLRGKLTVLSVVSTWSPFTAEQLNILDDLSRNSEINVVAVVAQEKNSKVAIFRKKGGYTLPIIADPDGELVEKLGISNVPTHIFLNRNGVIQKIKTGVFSKEELLKLVL